MLNKKHKGSYLNEYLPNKYTNINYSIDDIPEPIISSGKRNNYMYDYQWMPHGFETLKSLDNNCITMWLNESGKYMLQMSYDSEIREVGLSEIAVILKKIDNITFDENLEEDSWLPTSLKNLI